MKPTTSPNLEEFEATLDVHIDWLYLEQDIGSKMMTQIFTSAQYQLSVFIQ